jgi:two-component system NarL family sensor kinase
MVASRAHHSFSRGTTGKYLALSAQAATALENLRLVEEGRQIGVLAERQRLAREIHDTLAQGLTAIALNIEGALHRLESRPDQARERLERALAMARDNLEEARRSVLDLRATPLAGRPLAEALAALARSFTSETGVTVRVEADADLHLPLRVEAELFRIGQEALTNVRKHAGAHAVQITLRSRGQQVSLAIRDDGRGLPAETPRPDSQGVIGMRERARLLGGRLEISSRAGHGTRVVARVPLPDTSPSSARPRQVRQAAAMRGAREPRVR